MEIRSNKIRPYAVLVAGAALMYYSIWTWAFPAATWFFPIFLLRFSRTQKKRTGLPDVWLFVQTLIIGCRYPVPGRHHTGQHKKG